MRRRLSDPAGWPLEAWCRSLSAAGRSPSTRRLRRYQVARFGRSHPDPWAVDAVDVSDYLAAMRAAESKKGVKAALNQFYEWAVGTGRTDQNPVRKLPGVQVRDRGARPCPQAVIDLALAAEPDDDVRLMILLGSQCGLRAAEIAGVHTGDVDGARLSVLGKGGKRRSVPLNDLLRLELADRPPGYVFPGRFGGHLEPGTVTKKVSRSLGPGYTCHTLRHYAATKAYGRSHDVFMVQGILGHASAATTQRYVRLDDTAMQRWLDAMAS